MKKILKYLGIGLGIIFVIGLIAGFTINFRGIPTYEVDLPDYELLSTPAALERGEKLVRTLCAQCHMNPTTRKLTGTQMKDVPPEFGLVFSQNITQDKTYGIGDWTPAELLYLLRTGIKRDGQYAPPYMPKLPLMADEDINAIIAFLKSDHPLMAADNTPDRPCEPAFMTKMLCNVAWKPYPFPSEKIAAPDTSNQIELGKYLAQNLDCYGCHSADFKTINPLQPELSPGYFGGGNTLITPEGETIITANLTPHATGIGNMTEVQFIRAVRFGLKDGEPALRPPMPPFNLLTDKEAAAIYAYLQNIPPIDNKVEREFSD